MNLQVSIIFQMRKDNGLPTNLFQMTQADRSNSVVLLTTSILTAIKVIQFGLKTLFRL